MPILPIYRYYIGIGVKVESLVAGTVKFIDLKRADSRQTRVKETGFPSAKTGGEDGVIMSIYGFTKALKLIV